MIVVKESNTVGYVDLEFDEPLSDKITIVNASGSDVRFIVKNGSPISIIGSTASTVPGFIPPGNDSNNTDAVRLNLESNIYKIAENEFIATGLEGV